MYNRDVSNDYFNLMAELISIAIKCEEFRNPESLSRESADRNNHSARELINITIKNVDVFSKIRVDSSARDDIIEACRKNGFFFSRAVISILDSLIDLNTLVDIYDATGTKIVEEKMFNALNSNYAECGIYILPVLYRQKTKIKLTNQDGSIIKLERGNIRAIQNSLEESLQKTFFVENEKLNGFEIENVIVDLPKKDKEKDNITLGVSPLTNESFDSIFDYNCEKTKMENGDTTCEFNNVRVRNEEIATRRILNLFKKAQEKSVDIFVVPEMMCTSSLNCTSKYGFNKLIQDSTQGNYPYISVLGTFWHNNTNQCPVFLTGGKKLGAQFKYTSFNWKVDDGEKYKENLSNTPKKSLFLLHIQGWGILAFPICKDFLNTEFRNVLIESLRVNLFICPSFSPSMSGFETMVDSVGIYSANAIYINSCSALKHETDFIGGVYTPSVTSANRHIRLKKTCDGSNCDNCMFIINLPLNLEGDSNYEERTASCSHLHN